MKSLLSYVLTRTEKIILLVMVALALLCGWYVWIYHPIQLRIEAADTTELESEMEIEQMRAAKIKKMQAEIQENRAAGAPVVPSYNNFKKELDELNRIFGRGYDFAFQFAEPELEGKNIRRSMAVSFHADSYGSAVEMMREILRGPYRSMIHEVSITPDSRVYAAQEPDMRTGRVTVSFSLTYFETTTGADSLEGLRVQQEQTNQVGGLANADLSNLQRSELETAAEAVFGE